MGAIADARIPMRPITVELYERIRWLTTRLNRGIDPAVACVDSRLPVSLPPLSMPEPDIAIVPVGNYAHAHPAEALLVIEVAVSSRALDLGAKAEIYAAAGVAEYWVVDIPARTVHVHGSPAGGRYGACEQVATGSLPPPVPDAPSIDVQAMFAQLD